MREETPAAAVLAEIERCYDAIPRVSATTEEVGPFTLFIADADTGWQFYARPRWGWTEPVTAEDVRRVLARQHELGVPRAIEWVDEVTPTLHPAVHEAVPDAEVEVCPLLTMRCAEAAWTPTPGLRVITPDDPDLPAVVGAVEAAFGGRDEMRPGDPGHRPALVADGSLIVVAAYDAEGAVVGGGSAAPRDETAEVMGVAVLPRARRQGLGSAITRALVAAAHDQGVTRVFLSAASDDAASIYRAVGFARVGTAMILQLPG